MLEKEQMYRKHDGDLNREKVVYAYLLTISDLPELSLIISGSNIVCNATHSSKPNESSLSNQWGLDRSTTIRRILRFVLPKLYSEVDSPLPPSLTLGKIINILKNLEEYWKKKSGRTISRSEKMTALRLFFQCSQNEYQSIDLPPSSAEGLFHKLFDDIYDINKSKKINLTESKEKSLLLYKSFLTAWMDKENKNEDSSKSSDLEANILSFINNYSSVVTSSDEKDRISKAVLREISRIKMQNGNVQLLIADISEDIYFPLKFVKQLTISIIENTILSQGFPLQVESIGVEKVGPLPLSLGESSSLDSFLNKKVMDSIEDCDFCRIEKEDVYFGGENITSLENQCTYKVKVHFSMRLPDDINLKDFEELRIIEKETGNLIYFHEESRGIGSPLSHAISVVNSMLFSGIFLLEDFFPVASDIINIEQSVGNDRHSAIWSHNVVQLRLKKDIKKSIKDEVNFEEVNSSHNISHGDCCGFDLLETITRSSLYSRLRAIQQTGASPQQYQKELLEKIKEKAIIRKSKKMLDFYPFSLKAMEKNLAIYMTYHYWNSTTFKKGVKKWSLNAYDSVLTIISAYLQNGLFETAKKYLNLIEHIENSEDIDCLILSKFMLYKARYHYLSCTNQMGIYQNFDNYSGTVKYFLGKSLTALQDHVKWSNKIGEIASINLYPFSSILAQIYIFSAELRLLDQDYDKLIQSLKLFEKARILAARDGNSSLYSYISAYQSWCYLLVGTRIEYAGKASSQEIFVHHQNSIKKDCLSWSRKVLDHSIECYQQMGKQCFEDIKERGGQAGDEYGIESMPFIKEIYGNSSSYKDKEEAKLILELDVTQLKKHHDRQGREIKVYLFGTYSCIFLFSIGLTKLYELAFGIKSEDAEYEKLSFEEKVKSINQLLTYSFSIAEDGITDHHEEAEVYKRVRRKKEDIYEESRIRCLYPFRITQFADFGKIFSVVCELFLLTQMRQKDDRANESEAYKQRTQYIKYMLAELGKNDYNKHLEKCFELIKEDTSRFMEFLDKKGINLEMCKEKIMSNFFAYMHRGIGDRYDVHK